MIAFISAGGAGGNIVDEAARLGYPTAAINFSEKDLDSLENIDLKLRIMGSDGVGHNRELAISFIQQHWETVLNFIKDNFSNPSIEVIFITFSTGGGSGSGISPILIELLTEMMPEKTFVAVPILPDLTEVTVNQLNTIKTFEELSSLNICVLPVDNNKIHERSPCTGKGSLYKEVNLKVVKLIHDLYSYTEKYSKNGNFDKRDFVTLFSTRGITIIAEAEINKLTEKINLTQENITEIIHQSWNETIFAEIDYDHVIKVAIIFDAQESLMEFINYKLLFNKFSNGMPIDLFEGNYHEQKGKVITVLSGLSWCKKRLSKVEESIEVNREKVELALANSTNQSYQSKVGSFVDKLKKKPQKTKSISDILSKYKR